MESFGLETQRSLVFDCLREKRVDQRLQSLKYLLTDKSYQQFEMNWHSLQRDKSVTFSSLAPFAFLFYGR